MYYIGVSLLGGGKRHRKYEGEKEKKRVASSTQLAHAVSRRNCLKLVLSCFEALKQQLVWRKDSRLERYNSQFDHAFRQAVAASFSPCLNRVKHFQEATLIHSIHILVCSPHLYFPTLPNGIFFVSSLSSPYMYVFVLQKIKAASIYLTRRWNLWIPSLSSSIGVNIWTNRTNYLSTLTLAMDYESSKKLLFK